MYSQCLYVLDNLSFKYMECSHSNENKTFLDKNKNVILWCSFHQLFSIDRQYFSSLWFFLGYSKDLPPNSVFKISHKISHYYGVYVHTMCLYVRHWQLCGVTSLFPTSCGFWGWNSGHQACIANAFTCWAIWLLHYLFSFLQEINTIWLQIQQFRDIKAGT